MLTQEKSTPVTGGTAGESNAVHRVARRRVAIYCVTLFVLSYGLVGGFLLTGGSLNEPAFFLFAQLSSAMPAVTAVVLTKWRWREPLVRNLALRPRWNRWLPISWLAAVTLCLLSLGIGMMMPGVHWDGTLQSAVGRKLLSPEQLAAIVAIAKGSGLPPVTALFPIGILLSLTLSFAAGCGEELGWRGFVHGALRPLGFWRNAGVTGSLWLLWHLPLLALGYGFPEHPWAGALLTTAQLFVSSVILAYLREKAESALAAALFHGTSEAFALLSIAPLSGGSSLTTGILSLSWLVAALVILCSLLLYDRFGSRTPIAWTRSTVSG